MFKSAAISLLIVLAMFVTSCNEQDDIRGNVRANAEACLNETNYLNTMVSFTSNHKFQAIAKNRRCLAPDLQGNDNPEIISTLYEVGEYVGDPSDEVIGADGYIIKAPNNQVEEDTRLALKDGITKAKLFLTSQGLDFSDVYSSDDYRYIHAANIVMEMANEVGIPGSNKIIEAGSETIGGCVLEAFGIRQLYDIWYGKFATKRMLIKAVGKIAARYLGYVGAAISMYVFVDCMWGGKNMEELNENNLKEKGGFTYPWNYENKFATTPSL